jgi:hypothetical protein
VLLLGLIGYSLLYLNSTVYSLWAAGGPPTETPNYWMHRSLVNFGYFMALVSTSVFLFVVLKKGYSFKESKALYVWLVIMVLSIGYPIAKKEMEIDSCLDLGGKWSANRHACEM